MQPEDKPYCSFCGTTQSEQTKVEKIAGSRMHVCAPCKATIESDEKQAPTASAVLCGFCRKLHYHFRPGMNICEQCADQVQSQIQGSPFASLQLGPHCSFCKKQESEVGKLIAGQNGVYICNECITQFAKTRTT